jgi:hypothetical protein
MDFTWLGRCAAMGGAMEWHILTHLAARPTHWGARPSQSEFFPTKGHYYRQKYYSAHPHPSDHPTGEEAGCGGPGLAWLCVVCSCEAGWTMLLEKLTLNSLETALVDIPTVSMPIAHSLKAWDICGIVLCYKTAHCRVAFYYPRHKVHLCNDHSVQSASWYAIPVRWMDYIDKGEMLTNRYINKLCTTF